MKSLVLAEKPSVAKEYARVLKCHKKGKGYFESEKHIITWAYGHLITLGEPAYYDKRYKIWRLEDLPIIPEKMRLKTIKQTNSQFLIIKSLIKRKDIEEIIIATDAGREGELVARWIILLAGWKGKLKRLWISSQTDKAIREGFNNLKNAGEYFSLFLAAVGRAEADWIIGLNITRALTTKFDARLSAGRVQTPTLSIIIDREEEIKNFKPEDYWKLEVDFGNYKGEWREKSGNSNIKDIVKLEEIIKKLKGTGIVLSVNKSEKEEQPPSAYNLNDLQRDANTKLNFPAKKTLSVLQRLYETHKIATYPRTDSRHITEDMVSSLPSRLKAIYNPQYKLHIDKLLNDKLNSKKHFVDDKKVSDHHAIIPTEQRVPYDRLDNDEKRLFNLIAVRFLEVLSKNAKTSVNVAVVIINGEKIYITSKKTVQSGWKEIQSKNIEDTNPFNLRKGEKIKISSVNTVKLKTSPPARYSEASLLAVMESPAKFIKEKDLKETIKKGGLGTPATRADIIEKLINTDYIIRNDRALTPTDKAYQLMEFVPSELKSPRLTAKWELILKEIEDGKAKKAKFIEDISEFTRTIVDAVKRDERKYIPKNLTKIKCPLCNSFMLKTRNKTGTVLKCSNLKCGYIEEENKKQKDQAPFLKSSKKEQRYNKQLINRFTDKKKSSGLSIGGLLEKALSEKK